jgi:Domain of unknown function (DUF397)
MSSLDWRKSRRSGGNGGNCVEVAVSRRGSAPSGGTGGGCVEAAATEGAVRA